MNIAQTERCWYALYTRPNFEKRIHKTLQEMGLTSYLPMCRTLRQWSDRKKWIEVPLFYSYLFVHVDARERLLSLTPNGVVRMVSHNGQPSRIPEHEIEMVKRMLAGGYEPAPAERLLPGDWVEVTQGSLRGLRGVLQQQQGRQRLLVHFDGIGRTVSISIERDLVRKLATARAA